MYCSETGRELKRGESSSIKVMRELPYWDWATYDRFLPRLLEE
jgi:hypothetical protein